jgi:hypothetical protein
MYSRIFLCLIFLGYINSIKIIPEILTKTKEQLNLINKKGTSSDSIYDIYNKCIQISLNKKNKFVIIRRIFLTNAI